MNNSIWEVRNIWVQREYRGKKIISKMLWFLKTRMNYNPIVLGNLHSSDTQLIVRHGLNNFTKSWLNTKTGEKAPFSVNTLDSFYSLRSPTDWQILLENDGDFSDWPKFTGTDFLRDDFSWQIE